MRLVTPVVVVALLVIAIVCAATASAQRHSVSLNDEQPLFRSHWIRKEKLSEHTMEVTILLRHDQQKLAKLNDIVHAVNTPLTHSYGQFLSLSEVTDLVSVDPRMLSRVSKYWRDAGAFFVDHIATRDALVVHITADDLSRSLSGRPSFHRFEHAASSRSVYRTNEPWSMPSSIDDDVQLVTGVSDFHLYPKEQHGSKAWRRREGSRRSRSVDATSNAPFIVHVANGPNSIDADIQIFCENGSNTTNATAPCADQGNAVSVINLLLSFNNGYEDMACGAVPSDATCAFVSEFGTVVCAVQCTLPADYLRVGVNATLSYGANYSLSDTYTYPVRVVAAPYITMDLLKTTYNVPHGTRVLNANATQCAPEFENQFINLDDLTDFLELNGLPYEEPTIIGMNNQSYPGGESTLDIQLLMGVAPGAPTTMWSISGNVKKGAYILDWALAVSNVSDAPLVYSVSYGDTEIGYYNNYNGSYAYIERMEVELQKMAARGMTVFAGSGDAGASNVGEAGNDLSPTDATCSPLRAFYPSESQYVTSLSATFLGTGFVPICANYTGIDPVECEQLGEIAVGLPEGTYWTTGGGFSNLTFNPRPSFQNKAIGAYFANSEVQFPPSAIWNKNGRGYPDISALGYQMLVVDGGSVQPSGGTSASGPVAAALTTLLNDVRFSANLPPVGWINPLLYLLADKHPECFQDVTVGRNYDGDLQQKGSPFPSFCSAGYECSAGWDAVSGLGTLNFGEIAELINGLPFL